MCMCVYVCVFLLTRVCVCVCSEVAVKVCVRVFVINSVLSNAFLFYENLEKTESE